MFASSSLIKAYVLSHWAHCLIAFLPTFQYGKGQTTVSKRVIVKNYWRLTPTRKDINDLLDMDGFVPEGTKDMVNNNTSFADTSAGKAVLGELHELKNKLMEAQKSYEELSKKKAEEMRQALDAQKRLLDQRLKNMERQRDQAQETMDRKMKRLQREMEEREANLKKLEKESTKSEKQNAELKKKLRKLEKQQDAWKARSSDKGKSKSKRSGKYPVTIKLILLRVVVGNWSGSKSSGGSIQCSFTLSGTTLRGSGVSVTNNGQRSSFSVGSGSSYSDGSIRFIVDYGKSGTSNEEFSGRLSGNTISGSWSSVDRQAYLNAGWADHYVHGSFTLRR